ncbi:MAG: hypothetical protein Q9190_002929 [Brigantiaea leucoxantha]
MALEPAKFCEVAFWDPEPAGDGIRRTGNWSACPKFIDARYPFTTLLHQGLIEKVFIDDLQANGVTIQRPWTITDFRTIDCRSDHPLEISLKHVSEDKAETVRTKYLFSGEGARSFVRDRLGIKMHYKDPISHVWGVMDGTVRTNFPDVKMKCTIHSHHGSIMIIPRENNMVRLYVQIASSSDEDFDPRRKASVEEVQASAKNILQPYYIEWDHVDWYSVYPIGQGITEKYTPKAGQGMNTAFHDALNLAWKIHHVEGGFARRSILSSYESERKTIAEDLLDFDAKYAALFSQKIPSADDVGEGSMEDRDGENDEFVEIFKASQEFTSGYGIAYQPNEFNWSSSHTASSPLFMSHSTKLRIGRVMPTADVSRVVDANEVHLEQEIPLNGSFRIFLFGGNPSVTRRAVADFAANLTRKGSFYSAFEREDIASVSYHERHNPHSHFFTICTVFAARRSSIDIASMVPEVLSRYRDHIYADDVWEHRSLDATASAHRKMGLDAETGGVVIVRPDGHVGCALSLVEGDGTVDALNEYFAAFVSKPIGKVRANL